MVIVIGAIAAAYALTEVDQKGSAAGRVLIPGGTSNSMIIGAISGIILTVSSESNISGTLNSSHGVAFYIFTQAQFRLLENGTTASQTPQNVSEYVWTSGVVANGIPYTLNAPVSPGQWVFSYVNPNVSTPTGVGFYTDLTLNTA